MTQEGGHPRAGWYDDPRQPGRLRWWDGERWTTHARERPSPPEPDLDVLAELARIRAEANSAPSSRSLTPVIVGGAILLVALLITALILQTR